MEPKLLTDMGLDRYERAIAMLKQDQPGHLDLIEVLRSRDAVQKVLEMAQADPQAYPLPNEFWIQLAVLDERLQQFQGAIAQHPEMPRWRESFHPDESAWWWYLQPPPDPRDRYDWLWDALAIACFTASVALTQDIAGRFLGNNPSVLSSLGAIVPIFVTLFAGGGAFTRLGRETLDQLLSSVSIHPQRRSEAKFALAATLFSLLLAFHLLLPQLAQLYNRIGENNLAAGSLTSAKANFQRALKLWPDYPKAHYNLGVFYDQLNSTDNAQTQYQLAAQANVPAAYARLAELALDSQAYGQAAVDAMAGLDLAEQLDGTAQAVSPEVLASLQTGLGWAQLGQVQTDATLSEEGQQILLDQADAQLRAALALDANNGRAYCLLAQVEELQGNPTASQTWTQCQAQGTMASPPEMRWQQQAEERRLGNDINQQAPQPIPSPTPSASPRSPSNSFDDDDDDN